MFVVATAIVAGAMIGLPALHVGNVEIGLSLPVGVLLGGLVCGWLRSVRPRWFGRIPGPTLWVFESIGLDGFRRRRRAQRRPRFRARVCRPAASESRRRRRADDHRSRSLIGVLVGRWVFKMHPGVLLGVVAGGCTATPALAAVQEVAKSAVPSIGLRSRLRRRQRAACDLGHGHRRDARVSRVAKRRRTT